MLARVLSLGIGYLFGLFQTGYFYSKKKDFDLRSHGSGNSGTTNTIRTMGWKAGGIVFAGDLFKCILAVLLVGFLYRPVWGADVKLLELYAAFGAILGHDFPFYLKFQGGKGMACTAGLIIAAASPLIPWELVLFLILVLATRYVSLGSIIASIGLPVFAFITHKMGLYYAGGTYFTELMVLMCVIGALNISRHHANIGRLVHGTENKFGSHKEKEQK